MMNLKDRMRRAGPIWKRIVKREDTLIRQAVVAGASAGYIACAGILAGDKLISVMHYTPAATLADLTSEFLGSSSKSGNGAIIDRDGYINNTGGTDTSSDNLLVTWEAYDER